MRSIGAAVGLVVGIGVCAPASAAFVVRDKSFFNAIPHTFLDFETRGDGSPVGLCCLDGMQIPKNEYAAQGIVFDDRVVGLANVPPPSFGGGLIPEGGPGDAVQAIGSLSTVIGGGFDDWAIHFTQPVHAFGIAVIQDGLPFSDPTIHSRIDVYGADDALLASLVFDEDMWQGHFGNLYANGEFGEIYQLNYGFMGLASSAPIARIEFVNAWFTCYDDIDFSAVPAPGAGAALLLVGGIAALRRRR